MKKILWVEDNKGYVRGNLEELFGSNLSASDLDELRNMEGEDFSLKIKPFLRKRNIFIEEEFSKACAHIFKEGEADFDVIILDVKFPVNPTKKRQGIMETAKTLFVDAFADNDEERPQIEEVFAEILIKEEYSGLLLFYLICLHYERRKGCWKLSDVGSSVCFFTGNEVGLNHFQSLLKERSSSGYSLREGWKIREYVDSVKGNFWQKGDGDEYLKDFVEKIPYAAILRRNVGTEAERRFRELLDNKDDERSIISNLGHIRYAYEEMLKICLLKIPHMQKECTNDFGSLKKGQKTLDWLFKKGHINSLVKTFFYSINNIPSKFAIHTDDDELWREKHNPTLDTVNSLFYALRDTITWFDKICDQD